MKIPQIKPEWILWGVAIGAGFVWMRGLNRTVADVSETVAGVPGSLFQGASSGLLGIPRTDTPEAVSRCQQALAEGNDWEASFYCPASKWWGGVWDGR